MSSNIRIQKICKNCGREFTAQTTVTKYCSPRCSKAAYKKRQRDEKIQKSNQETVSLIRKPMEDLKAKEFLSISETSQLMGISRRTIYRMFERNELISGKAGRRRLIRRSDLDSLFETPVEAPKQYKVEECYNLTEIQSIFGISEKALYDLVKRNNIPKIKQGKYAYLPKEIIDDLFKKIKN